MRAILTITIDYDDSAFARAEDAMRAIRETLDAAPTFMAGEGLMTGTTELLVDNWSHEVRVRDE